MGMKNRIRIALLIVAAIATTLLFSCAPPAVSIEQRISDFITSLNGDRTDTYTNLDPSTAAYSTTKPSGFWDTTFPGAKIPYSYSPNPPSTTTPTDVEITIYDKSAVTMGVFQFVMVNIGDKSDNWVIHDLMTPPGGAHVF
jgi:hypothetical protein